MPNNIQQKTYLFAVRIVNLCKYLRKTDIDATILRQLIRSGTSIGANIAEAQHAQSTADFIAKMHIAYKETSETKYWLTLLTDTEYLSKKESMSILKDCCEIEKILTATLKSLKKNQTKNNSKT